MSLFLITWWLLCFQISVVPPGHGDDDAGAAVAARCRNAAGAEVGYLAHLSDDLAAKQQLDVDGLRREEGGGLIVGQRQLVHVDGHPHVVGIELLKADPRFVAIVAMPENVEQISDGIAVDW